MTLHQQKRHKLNLNWNHSINGVCKRLWHHHVKNSKHRGHSAPTYTQQELHDWILIQPNFMSLYTAWADSNYAHNKAVSIDRIKNNIGYSFDNIQLVDFQTNMENARRDVRNKILPNSGLLNGGHRAVTMFTLSGTPICSFISMTMASIVLNKNKHTSISACCLGTKLYFIKYLWCYADKFEDFVKNTVPNLSKKAIAEYRIKEASVLQYDLNMQFIAEHSTITEAARYNELTFNLVSKWIKHQSTTITPTFIFKLKEVVID